MQQKTQPDFTILLIGIIILIAALCSCARELHTGKYVIESVNGKSTVNFKGVSGEIGTCLVLIL